MCFSIRGLYGSRLTFTQIPLGQNIHVTTNRSVSDGTYIGFMILTFLGALLAWCLVDAKHVLRTDGSRVILMKHPTWQTEILGLWEVLRSDSYIVLLFPLFCKSFSIQTDISFRAHDPDGERRRDPMSHVFCDAIDPG